MASKDWRERYIDLQANVPYELMTGKEINVILIQNTDTTNIIYAGKESGTNSTSFETSISPAQWGIIARPFLFRKAYLFSTGNISRVKIVEAVVPDPLILLKNIIGGGTTDVTVSSTVGLKSSELNIEATTKNLFVKEVTSTGITTGQITVNTTPQALGVSTPCREVLIQAPITNSATVKIGNSTAQYIELAPGDSISIPIDNINKIYAVTSTGTETINWLSRE